MVNMKILDLPLKAKWYEMIESGNKKEEYREIKKYWIGRLAKCGGRNSYEKTGFYCKKAICFSCITRGNGFHPKEYTHVRFRFAGIWITVKSFHDEDEEYAKNCANELLEKLNEKI